MVKQKIEKFLNFLCNSPSPFHAVENALKLLQEHSFHLVKEADTHWNLQPGSKYVLTKNGSSLIAMVIGPSFDPRASTSALRIIGTHVDSPCLRIKPISNRSTKEGLLQVAVETYGGGLWHTWFDRDLGVAGRIALGQESKGNGSVSVSLVKSKKSVLRIPTLAIHLDHSVREAFKFNTEKHLLPILGIDQGNKREESTVGVSVHHKELMDALDVSGHAQRTLSSTDLLSSELVLFDCQDPGLGGARDEFIFSARLDNLCSTWCALEAITGSASHDPHALNMIVLYDNEEVGSLSPPGADSNLLEIIIARIIEELLKENPYPASLSNSLLARSLLISADMAHAAHPNYPEHHDELLRPRLGQGPVIKYSSNARYATNLMSAALIKSIALNHYIPIQHFMTRNDTPCGTTIGPIAAARLGIACVDLGVPQLSMHSIREQCAVEDVLNEIRLFEAIFASKVELTNPANHHHPSR